MRGKERRKRWGLSESIWKVCSAWRRKEKKKTPNGKWAAVVQYITDEGTQNEYSLFWFSFQKNWRYHRVYIDHLTKVSVMSIVLIYSRMTRLSSFGWWIRGGHFVRSWDQHLKDGSQSLKMTWFKPWMILIASCRQQNELKLLYIVTGRLFAFIRFVMPHASFEMLSTRKLVAYFKHSNDDSMIECMTYLSNRILFMVIYLIPLLYDTLLHGLYIYLTIHVSCWWTKRYNESQCVEERRMSEKRRWHRGS